MPKSDIYDFIHPKDGNLMKAWSETLQKKERAKLNSKIDALAMHGPDLIPNILAPTGVPSIFKLRVQGQVKLRPMVCEGPGKSVFTFLLGAKEVSWEYEPKNAPETASGYRAEVLANPKDRSVKHERVN